MEQKKRGRPRMTDEEKAAAKIARLQKQMESAPEPPPPPGDEPSPKKGGKGVDKVDAMKRIAEAVMRGKNAPKCDMNNPDEIQERLELMVKTCVENGVPVTPGMKYKWLGYSKTYYKAVQGRVDGYIKSDRVVEILNEFDRTEQAMVEAESAMNLIPPAQSILFQTNCYGYRDVKQVEHSDEVNIRIGGSDLKTLNERYAAKEIGVVEADYEIIAERDDPGNGS